MGTTPCLPTGEPGATFERERARVTVVATPTAKTVGAALLGVFLMPGARGLGRGGRSRRSRGRAHSGTMTGCFATLFGVLASGTPSSPTSLVPQQ